MLKKKNVGKKEEAPALSKMTVGKPVDEEMTSPEVASEKPNGRGKKEVRRKFVVGLVIGLVAALVIIAVVMSYLFYKNPAKYPVLEKVGAALHLPMAKVNGEFVSYSDFYRDYQTLKHYYDQQVKNGSIPAERVPAEQQNRQDMSEQLISKTLIEQFAKKYNISISNIEIDSNWKKEVLPYFNNDEKKAEEKVKEDYNMTVDEFKQRMIKENLLYDKVDQVIELDPAVQDAIKARAERILQEIKDGKLDFAKAAAQYSDDTATKVKGGDLDWFARGKMVPEFEEVAFNKLKAGEMSDLVKTQYGYHIIKVVEKKGSAEGKDEQVKASHILIVPSLANYLQEVKQSPIIKRYIKFE